jgi:26S proteasome regulatory subunit N11
MGHQDERAVGIVVEPVLSARGKDVIGAFRNIPGYKEKRIAAGKVRREKTSFVGEMVQPSATTRHQGLNLRYYMLPIVCDFNEHEKSKLW